MSDDIVRPIIIKKIIKKTAAGHHGGAWKVAYADFVTAMMAFFLLLWLLNATTEEQKRGISDYFAPASVAKTTSGSGGMLGGLALSKKGAMRATSSPMSFGTASQSPNDQARDEIEEDKAEGESKEIDEQDLEQALAEREQDEFAEAEARLRQAIQEAPDMRRLAESLVFDMTPEGMRIQIVDQEALSMFPIGSSRMFDHTRRLIRQVAKVVANLPNRISISGHTDSTPYAQKNGYSNWELSTDRANASRRMLLEGGLPADRIASVTGKADRDHLFPEQPTSPRNRRISIVLLHRAGPDEDQKNRAARHAGPDSPPSPAIPARNVPPSPAIPARNIPPPPGSASSGG